MSRRKRKPGPRAPISGLIVKIVCTGRGTHPPSNLGAVRVRANIRRVTRLKGPRPWVDGDDPRQPGGVRLTCTYECNQCGRHVPLQRVAEDDLLIRLAESGLTVLDISAMHVM